MKIGIVSDSHGNVRRLQAALDAFAGRGAQAVVHCGDVGGVKCLHALADSGLKSYVVAGNTDRRADRLEQTARRLNIRFAWEVIEVPIAGGEYLVATHGSDAKILGELIAGRQFPYVCRGHTHRASDERHGPVRVINPGALHHPKHPRCPTAALLNTETGALEQIVLGE